MCTVFLPQFNFEIGTEIMWSHRKRWSVTSAHLSLHFLSAATLLPTSKSQGTVEMRSNVEPVLNCLLVFSALWIPSLVSDLLSFSLFEFWYLLPTLFWFLIPATDCLDSALLLDVWLLPWDASQTSQKQHILNGTLFSPPNPSPYLQFSISTNGTHIHPTVHVTVSDTPHIQSMSKYYSSNSPYMNIIFRQNSIRQKPGPGLDLFTGVLGSSGRVRQGS